MLRIKKTKHGDFVLSISVFPPLNWVVTQLKAIFNSLDQLTAHHGLLSVIGALGLGFGMGVTVFQHPTISSASLEIVRVTEGVAVEKISVPSIDAQVYASDVSVKGQLTSFGVLQISDSLTNRVFNRLSEVQLGQEIIVMGSNNGEYHYRVIEIIHTSREKLSERTAHLDHALIITTPAAIFSTDLTVVVAKP